MRSLRAFSLTVTAGALLAGCASVKLPGEKQARNRLDTVTAALAPAALPTPAGSGLTSNSPVADFARFAALRHPAVRAAYHDWRAAVESIAPARALPDPKLSLEADITNEVMTLMPGLMFDFMAAGKRRAMAHEATAGAEVARRTFVAEVARAAGGVHKAWVELAYVVELERLYTTTIHAVDEALALADADYATAKGMAGFEKQIRLQNVIAQHHAHHIAAAERLVSARARFKSALGLAPADDDPPWPQPVLAVSPVPPDAELWQRVTTLNPDLAKMRAMVEMAVAGVEVSRNAGKPDFAVGAMADVLANPLMVRPAANVSLPIWREKIAAGLRAAEARRDAAVARVSAEQLTMAAELAQMLFMVREADRMLAFMDGVILPNLARGLAFAEAGAASGMGNPAMISETRMMTTDMRHERLETLRQRENAVVDLAVMTSSVTPAGAAFGTDAVARNP